MLDKGALPLLFTAGFSPDGAHLLLGRGRGQNDAGFDLYESDGTLLRRHGGGDWAFWVDSNRYLLIDVTNGDTVYEGTVVDVASGQEETEVLPNEFVLSNGQGVLAFVEPYRYGKRCEPWGCPDPRFALWTPEAGLTAWHSGRPLGWSRSGEQLFVLNVDTASKPIGAPGTQTLKGWLEILQMPDLKSLRRYRDVNVNDDLFTLDPNSPHLAFTDPQLDAIRLLDLDSGKVGEISAPGYVATWNDVSQLIVGPTADGDWTPRGDAFVVDPSGEIVARWPGVGEHVIGTPDGSVIVFSEDNGEGATPTVTAFVGGERFDIQRVSTPGFTVRCWPAIAPDGSALALACNYYDARAEIDNAVALIRPLP